MPPTPIVGVGAAIRGVNPMPPPNVGVTVGVGATIRGVNPMPPPNVGVNVGVTVGIGATIRGVNPIPPPNVGVTVGVGANVKAGKVAAVVGTVGTVGNIRDVGHNPIPPPMIPGATDGVGATIRGVKPPTPIVGLTVGTGATISVVTVMPGAVVVGRITALALNETNPKTVIITRLINKDFKNLIF